MNFLFTQYERLSSLSERVLPYTLVSNLSEWANTRPEYPDDQNLVVVRQTKENEKLGKTDKGLEFSITSYNILCQDYVTRFHYLHCPSKFKTQEYRLNLLLKEVEKNLQSDFYCFQEVNPSSFSFLLTEMKQRGYLGEYKKKSRDGKDGVAIFYKDTKDIKLLQVKELELDEISDQVCKQLNLDTYQLGLLLKTVALFCLFEIIDPLTGGSKLVALGNVHINYDWTRHDIQCFQVAKTVEELHKFAQSHLTNNIILCGDFNILPNTIGYQLMRTGTCNVQNFESMRVVPVTVDGELTYNYKLLAQHLNHPISDFKSAYATVDGLDREPNYTNYCKDFKGCLDYILYTGEMKVKDVLNVVSEKDIEPLGYCPNQRFPSDHLSIKSTFTF